MNKLCKNIFCHAICNKFYYILLFIKFFVGSKQSTYVYKISEARIYKPGILHKSIVIDIGFFEINLKEILSDVTTQHVICIFLSNYVYFKGVFTYNK